MKAHIRLKLRKSLSIEGILHWVDFLPVGVTAPSPDFSQAIKNQFT